MRTVRSLVRRICKSCKKPFMCRYAEIKYRGKRPFCSQTCFGLSRRKNRTEAQRKNLKRLYDIEYRRKNRAMLKAKKAANYANIREQVERKMKRVRKTPAYKRRMRAYLKQYWKVPGRKVIKKDYDRKFRAKKKFGPYWEAHYLMMLINDEVRSRMSAYESRILRGTYNKALMRSRNGEVKRGYT